MLEPSSINFGQIVHYMTSLSFSIIVRQHLLIIVLIIQSHRQQGLNSIQLLQSLVAL